MSTSAASFYAVTAQQVQPFVKNIDDIPILELKGSIRGSVFTRNDKSFANYARLFNGALQTPACILTCPKDAQDVSEILKFCRKHKLSPSVKSGGYGTHGLSVEGDVIIDIHNLQDVSLSTENIPLRGSVAAMDIKEPRADGLPETPIFPYAAYPASIVDPYAPPELLKRKRGADSDDARPVDGEPDPMIPLPAIVQANRPSIASTGRTASFASVAMTRAGGSSSDSSSKPSEDSDGRRTRPRHIGPTEYSEEDAMLAGGFSMPPRPEIANEPDSSGSGSASRDGLTPLSGSSRDGMVSPLTSVPEDDKETGSDGAAVLPRPSEPETTAPFTRPARRAAPRGPFSYSTSYNPPSVQPEPLPAEASSSTNPNTTYGTQPIEPPVPFVYVTFGAGASQKQVDAYTTSNPLPGKTSLGASVDVPYYVPFAAHPVGTTVMMLGGFGFQTRLRGLSVDALVEVEMVLADGRIVVVNEDENSDLWWAIRGAGTAFGIATCYKARAYPIPVVYAGNILYPFNRATAASLIRHFRDCVKQAPRELYANVILTAGPRRPSSPDDDKHALVVIQICWLGPKEGGLPIVSAILSWTGGQCLLNEVNEKTFSNQQDSVAKVLKAAAGRKWFLRADVVTSLTDELIHSSVNRFVDTPDGCAWLFELGGGALPDFKDTCIPAPIREGNFNIVAFHQWKIEDSDVRCVESAEEWMQEDVYKLSAGGPIPCFFERKELVTRTIGTYGQANWDRLTAIKRQYDPQGELRHTFWPLDEDGRPINLFDTAPDVQDEDLPAEHGKGKPATDAEPSSSTIVKGKGREDRRHGNHFMDRFLAP